MTEEQALNMTSGFIDYPDMIGYLPLDAANFLVSTGKWEFYQVTPWGYVIRKVKDVC